MRKLYSLLLMLFFVIAAHAQIQEPVKFKTELKTLSETEAEIVFNATVDKGWHVYSTDLGSDGPVSATFNVDKKEGVELIGKLTPRGNVVSKYDPMFEMTLRFFEDKASFVQKIKFTAPTYKIEGYLEYGACNDENCLPPTQVPFDYSGKTSLKAAVADAKTNDAESQDTDGTEATTGQGVTEVATTPASEQPVVSADILWEPVIEDLQSFGRSMHSRKINHGFIFLLLVFWEV